MKRTMVQLFLLRPPVRPIRGQDNCSISDGTRKSRTILWGWVVLVIRLLKHDLDTIAIWMDLLRLLQVAGSVSEVMLIWKLEIR